ncbi:hypothetical protein WOLCODRAFT_159620 [Wolfiporia cocos MD-104 SS10]|uniref:Uncharacterized protein n=1 Tax=Wolfiporia cocos (strain MD-104) TaxID=742152 RepID=A0A2H3JBD0_WOLCO|nr:hypothetical protein WOLCODRAFT_159620 [Wolfiporia cocos MD-104 SS10]
MLSPLATGKVPGHCPAWKAAALAWQVDMGGRAPQWDDWQWHREREDMSTPYCSDYSEMACLVGH